MSNKKLEILAVAATAMFIWAVIQAKFVNRPAETIKKVKTNLIQGLSPDKIAKIVIGASDKQIILKRRENRFVVVNKDNYPAQTGKVNDLIMDLLGIKTVEFITDNPQNHQDLQVTEEKTRNVVKLFDKENEIITGVIVGKGAETAGTYVRLASENDVYLTEQPPWVREDPLDYLEQKILDLDQKNIARVTVSDPNGTYTLKSEPNDSGIILVEKIPEGKKLKDNEYEQVFKALTSLSFDDVMSLKSAPNNLEFDASYACLLHDSTLYKIDIAETNDANYIKCRAEFTGAQKKVTITRDESEEQLKKKEAILLAQDAVQEFNEKHAGWVYKISDYKAKNLTRDFDELLEDETPEKQPAEDKTPVEQPGGQVSPEQKTGDEQAAEPNDQEPVVKPEEPDQTEEANQPSQPNRPEEPDIAPEEQDANATSAP